MASIITFEKQPETVWIYTYNIYVNGQFVGYIGKCNRDSKPFAFSTDYCINSKANTFNELKKLVKQKIKEKLNEL